MAIHLTSRSVLVGLAFFIALGATSAEAASGTFPNQAWTSDQLNERVSPVMSQGKHFNMSNAIDGYLFLGGNAEHEIWDISDPLSPIKMSELNSAYASGEAESHQHSFARYPDGTLYAATISGRGIDIWDITNAANPVYIKAVLLESINYGDNTNAVWGISWQGDYIYVGGTNTGLHIVDASDPDSAFVAGRWATSNFCNVSVGPLYAMGNILAYGTPKGNQGIVTVDISNPLSPALLDCEVPDRGDSYFSGLLGKNFHLLNPLRTYDVLTDPSNIRLLGSDTHPPGEYMNFDEGKLHLGLVRGSVNGRGGVRVYDISNPSDIQLLNHIEGRPFRNTDDQFPLAIGNLMVIADDEAAKAMGAWMAPIHTQTDSRPPKVLHVEPRDGSTGNPPTSRIGISFDSHVELASIDQSSLIVRPVGGTQITGKWGYNGTVVHFWPDSPLREGTEYEVILPAGGVTDLVGNAIEDQYRWTFSVTSAAQANRCAIDPLQPTPVGSTATLSASNPDTMNYTYSWDLGNGAKANGAEVRHDYDDIGRYPVVLTASPIASAIDLTLEAEQGVYSGLVMTATIHDGYSDPGYADYPSSTGSDVFIRWTVNAAKAGSARFNFRYALESGSRPLNLYVNGDNAGTLNFNATGTWNSWLTESIDAALVSGENTIELVADAGSPGPNVDQVQISGASVSARSCSRTQIIHRPLTDNLATTSSSVVVDEPNGRVWAVNPDANTVTAVNMDTQSKAFEVTVGRSPRTLASAPNGDIWVVNQGSASISVLNEPSGATLATIDLPRGSKPYGLAFSPDGQNAYVTLQAVGRLVRLDPATREVTGTLNFSTSTVTPELRGLAVTADSDTVLVARFVSPRDEGQVYRVDASSFTHASTIALENSTIPDNPDGGRGIPNYISSLVISPDGVDVWVPSKQDNLSRGTFRDGKPLTHDNTLRPVTSRIDLSIGKEVLADRVDHNDANMPFAAVTSPQGDLVFVTLQGNDLVDIIDAYSQNVIATIDVGAAPQGVALDSGGRLYVQNFMGRSLSIVDVSGILDGTDNTGSTLATVDLVDVEPLSEQVLRGKTLFYSAEPRISKEQYISCASCHLDGGQDGQVWDFTGRGEGLRNTTTLIGHAGNDQAMSHWTGNFDEIHDFENDIRHSFGGTGLMSDADFEATSDPLGPPKAGLSADLDALAAYVNSLGSVGTSPYRNSDGSLSDAAANGKALFQSLNCSNCHEGTGFTDSALNVLHDVGTIQVHSGGRRGETLTGFDTPTLVGLWQTAPYLHDGSAATLFEVINNASHGNASELSAEEKNELVAYLLSIDDRETGIVQAENGVYSGGVTTATNHAGYNQAGFADYPNASGRNVYVQWTIKVPRADVYTFDVRYALASGLRSLNLYVNGVNVGTLDFTATGAWTTWSTESIMAFMVPGDNTVELVANAGSRGPKVDQMHVSGLSGTLTGVGPR